MDRYSDNVELKPGMDVVGSEGDKVGKIASLDGNRIVVEKGFFFPSDYYIPMTAVDNADDDKVYLNVTKDEALAQKWDTDASSTLTTTGTAAYDTTAQTGAFDTTAGATARTGAFDAAATTDRTTRTADDNPLTIDVHEEELTATKRQVDAGEVKINTRVVSEERTLEVPITEERVHVTRRRVDRADVGGDVSFKEGTIEVPLHSEQVDLQKRVHVAEEVEIAKESVQKTQQVSGTVRREVVDVVDNTQVDVAGGKSGATAAGSSTVDSMTGSVKDGGKGLIDKAKDAVDNVSDTAKSKTNRS